eukprot:COSAG02_NODE_33712_length_496_cov_0.604534_1_plen_98_part_10
MAMTMMVVVVVVVMMGLGMGGLADEAPPPPAPLKPPPKISEACLLKAGPKQNTSFFHSKEAESIIGSWGVITGAHAAPTASPQFGSVQFRCLTDTAAP